MDSALGKETFSQLSQPKLSYTNVKATGSDEQLGVNEALGLGIPGEECGHWPESSSLPVPWESEAQERERDLPQGQGSQVSYVGPFPVHTAASQEPGAILGEGGNSVRALVL